MNKINFFNYKAPVGDSELFTTLFENKKIKIERIVSHGHMTPYDDVYDQNHDEWVIVIQGNAILRFVDTNEVQTIMQGDHIFIEAHKKHRVEHTDPNSDTIWLAVHIINE